MVCCICGDRKRRSAVAGRAELELGSVRLLRKTGRLALSERGSEEARKQGGQGGASKGLILLGSGSKSAEQIGA